LTDNTPSRLIVGMTGATGAIFGVRLLQALQGSEVETHLVMSKWGASTLVHETEYSVEDVQQMANYAYRATIKALRYRAALSSPRGWWCVRAACVRSPQLRRGMAST